MYRVIRINSTVKITSDLHRTPKPDSSGVVTEAAKVSIFEAETRGTVPRYSARLRYIAWTCMERVFFILTVWPSKIEMKKHALHASPGDVS